MLILASKNLYTFPLENRNFIEPGPPREILSLHTKPLGHESWSALFPPRKNWIHKLSVVFLFAITRLFYSKKIIFISYSNGEHESTEYTRKFISLSLCLEI